MILPSTAQTFALATADTAVRISATATDLSLVSLRASGGKREWIATPVPLPFVDSATVDGAKIRLVWRLAASECDARKATFVFLCDRPALELRSVWTASKGPGPVRHFLSLVNQNDKSVTLGLQPSLAFDFAANDEKDLELTWVEKGGQWPSAVGTHRLSIDHGFGVDLRSTPYSSDNEPRGAIPWLCVQDRKRREGWYSGIAFSGRVRQSVRDLGDLRLRTEMGTDPEGPVPYSTILPSGERFDAPPVFVGAYRGDVDDGANRLRRWVEEEVRPRTDDARDPLVSFNSWGSGMAVDDRLARSMMADAVTLGAEMFHIDAGWFREVGDWRVSTAKFPKGLASVAEEARAKGLRFGLWTGWTQGGLGKPESDVLSVRDPARRDWFAHDVAVDWKMPAEFIGSDVCLASVPARDWALGQMTRVVEENHVGMIEHDQRMIVESCDRTDHGHTAHPADVAHHAALGYYAVQDALRARFPDLMFEDCVNGGHMVDYGVLARVHYVSITDTYNPVANRRAFYDASFALPPRMCECYVEEGHGPTLGTFKTMLRSGMMGWFTLMCDPAKWDAPRREAARRQIEIYKTWLRPLIRSGNLYHLTDRPDGRQWDAMGYADPKTGRGVVYAFRGTEAGAQTRVRPKGFDPKRTYRVWSEDRPWETTADGASLMERGIEVRIDEPGASEIVYLQSVRP